ncbi:MAG: LysM peptidoglycan-binding domain-containing protein [Planctomycetota bacterium]|nr:LysM peptidoglycan-binding domain-containing protein [Planctomycetota bacterium]
MTRELKLALIVGFSLVLVVTVLISDHLSRARTSTLDTTIAERPALTPEAGGEPDVYESTDAPAPARTLASGEERAEPKPDVPAEPPAVELTMSRTGTRDVASGGNGSDSEFDAIRRMIEEAGGRIENGTIYLPPAVKVQPGAPAGEKPQTPPVAPPPTAVPTTPPPAAAVPTREYVVKSGDTAYRIAKRELGDGEQWRTIVSLNAGRVSADGRVRLGQKLLLPAKAGAAGPKDTPRAGTPTPSKRTYTVRKGDTLGEIASRELKSSRRAKEILELNRDVIRNPDVVPAGTVLKMPG